MDEDQLSTEVMKAIIGRVSNKVNIIFENGSVIETVESENVIRGKGSGLWWINEDEEGLIEEVLVMKGEKIADLIVEWANKQSIHPDDFNVLFVEELMEMLDQDKEDAE